MESNGTTLIDKCHDLEVANGLDHVEGKMKEFDDRYRSLKAFADKERERILEIGKQLDECQIHLTPIEDLIRLARRTLDEKILLDDDNDHGRKIISDIEVRSYFCDFSFVFSCRKATRGSLQKIIL